MRRMLGTLWRLLRRDADSGTRRLEERYQRELQHLDATLQEEKVKVEALARITYIEWKIRQERDKAFTLRFGVQMTRTTLQAEQDRFFTAFEQRLEQELVRREDEIEQRRIGYVEQRAEAAQLEERRQMAEQAVQELEDDLR